MLLVALSMDTSVGMGESSHLSRVVCVCVCDSGIEGRFLGCAKVMGDCKGEYSLDVNYELLVSMACINLSINRRQSEPVIFATRKFIRSGYFAIKVHQK